MSDTPLPLRVGPTLAAITLATAVGGLLLGSSCAYATQPIHPASAIGALVCLWILSAGVVYAANQQWLGRIRQERVERFVLCLLVAAPLQVPLWIVGVNVFESLAP
jgi:hypothetical protein